MNAGKLPEMASNIQLPAADVNRVPSALHPSTASPI
jgi:hypothetical protein